MQGDQGFNSLGQLEIPEAALEELLVNALMHRDYFTSASIRLQRYRLTAKGAAALVALISQDGQP